MSGRLSVLGCYSYVEHPVAWGYEDWAKGKDAFRDADPGVPYRFSEYKRHFRHCSIIVRKSCHTRSTDMPPLSRFVRC